MTPRMTAIVVDITTLDVDAIVNAANEDLWEGGGVCGAIFRAAGTRLAAACQRVAPCPTGEARITPGFGLPARYVIHAVGPVWEDGRRSEPDLLAAAYAASLGLAEENGCRSVAFPAISTGIYGFPLQAATAIAVRTVRDCLAARKTVIEAVVFACFSEEALAAYRAEGVP